MKTIYYLWNGWRTEIIDHPGKLRMVEVLELADGRRLVVCVE